MISFKSLLSLGKHAFLSVALVAAASTALADGEKKWDEQPSVKKSVAPKNPQKLT